MKEKRGQEKKTRELHHQQRRGRLKGRSSQFLRVGCSPTVGRNVEGWLQSAPEEWPQSPDYTFMSEVVRDMLVINDCAENNIKAITDYIYKLHRGCQWNARRHYPCL